MRILILSSSTGGGHDMRARSLQLWNPASAEINPENPTAIDRYQALEDSAWIYKFGVGLYNLIQKNCPALHHAYFNWLEVFHVSAHENLLLGKQRFIQALKKSRPDLILSVHAHTNHAFRTLAKRTRPQACFVTYCGELFGGYGFSRHWVDPGADAFIGATSEICAAARNAGMPPDRIKLGGFLLHPKFYAPPLLPEEKQALLCHELQLRPDRFTLLLSTGANGAHNHRACIAALEKAQLPVQVIALCGRAPAAKAQLETFSRTISSVQVRALGYRDDMCALMQIAHAIVARPGTGTTSEAILAACPLLLNTIGGIMPQESITVKYLRAKGLDAPRINRPNQLPDLVSRLCENPDRVPTLQRQMAALRPKIQPPQIFDYLFDLFHRSRSLPTPPSGSPSL